MRGLLPAVVACILVLSAVGAAGEDEHVPVPYAPEEFPPWANDLRRAEIVFFGSLPFTLFFTFEAYDIGHYVASGFDPLETPWPFRTGAEIGAGYTPEETGWLIASALAVSLGVAVADFLIVHRPAKREDR